VGVEKANKARKVGSSSAVCPVHSRWSSIARPAALAACWFRDNGGFWPAAFAFALAPPFA